MSTMTAEKRKFKISKDIRELITAPTPHERAQLIANIERDGIREPLTVGIIDGSDPVLLDGYNRYSIAKAKGLPFKIKTLRFNNIQEAHNWVINNQLGRRNITEEQRRYLIGKLYADLRPAQGQHAGESENGDVPETVSADELGAKYGVTGRTVRRSEQFAAVLDRLDHKTRDKILSGEVRVTDKQLMEAAELSAAKLLSWENKLMSGRLERKAESKPKRSNRRLLQVPKGTENKSNVDGADPRAVQTAKADFSRLVKSLNRIGVYKTARPLMEKLLDCIEQA